MSTIPEPLSPPDCDLRGFAHMPLFGHRLFGSRLYSVASPAEFRAALRLWWAAWMQCPAGSLPADDHELAMLADFGRDVKSWRKVKEMALHGFVLCSDGRLYHPMLCEAAVEAYDGRLRRQAKREQDRARLQKWRETQKHRPGNGGGNGGGEREESADETPVETSDETRFGTRVETRVREERRGEEVAPRAHMHTREPAREAVPAQPVATIGATPSPGDPPHKWLHLGDTRQVDESGVPRPVVAGYFLDVVAREVCEAAKINQASWRGDWKPLIAWLRDGIDPYAVILPTIKAQATRRGYTPPRFLSYFDAAVRERRAA